MSKDLISFADLVSGTGGIDTLASAIRKAAAPSDKFVGKNTFKARVLRQVGVDMDAKDMQNMTGVEAGNLSQLKGGGYQGYYVMILEDSPHSFLPNPCAQGDAGTSKVGDNHLLQSMYTTALYSGPGLNPGDEVMIRMEKKGFSYDTDIAYIVERIGSNMVRASKEMTGCVKGSDAFKGSQSSPQAMGGGPTTARKAKIAEDVQELRDKSTATVPAGTRIVSQMDKAVRRKIKGAALAENARWNGGSKKFVENNATDKSSGEYAAIFAYWKATAPDWSAEKINNNIYGQTGTKIAHWSSVFVSYIFWKAFGEGDVKANFNASSAHVYYMDHPLWKSYDAMAKDGKIKAEVGDVLLTVYDPGPAPPGGYRDLANIHGDIVYTIKNGKAYTAGGNLGNTVSLARSVKLDDDGNYIPEESALTYSSRSPPYYSIMKYKPKEEAYTYAPGESSV